MKTKIGTSFGLASMLAIGVIATMLALGIFAPSTAKANPGAIVIPVVGGAGPTAGDPILLTNVPTTPGEAATYTMSFQNATQLTAGSGQIHVLFDKNISVPSSIEKERITISVSGGGISNPVFDPEISTDPNGDTVISLTVGDTDPATTGTQHIPASLATALDPSSNTNSGHVLQFSKLAGITNATTPTTDSTSWVKMSDDAVTYGDAQTINVYRWLELSSTSGSKGKEITLTGKAFSSGTNATIFLDPNSNGEIDAAEVTLGSSDAAISGGAFTASITIDTNFAVGKNSINAIDGRGTSNSFLNGTDNGTPRRWAQKFTLSGSVSVTPTDAVRGETVTVTLTDYGKETGADGTVTSIRFGGVPADLSDITRTYTDNSGDFAVAIPSTAPLGTQKVDVIDTLEDTSAPGPSASITISALALTVSPSTAVANQKITVSGSGFVGAGTVTADTITAGTVTVDHSAITVDDSGNLITTFRLPTGAGSTAGTDANGVLRTPGEHEIKITDSAGRIGTVRVTVPSRIITIDPTSSRRSSTVTMTGTGFVASKTVNITHGSTTVGTVTADSAGNFESTFTVPSGAGIPSTNTVTATVGTPSTGPQRTATATHKVPGATITLSETSAASGNTITVSGVDFPGFVSLSVLSIGGISALPSPSPATSEEGTFSTPILVPALSTGTQTVLVTAGDISANLPITVVAASAAPVVADVPATALATMITDDTLDIMWLFNSSTKVWQFFNPDPDFSDFNDLTGLNAGEAYDIKVKSDTTVDLNGTSRTLTCVDDNCWNRIVW